MVFGIFKKITDKFKTSQPLNNSIIQTQNSSTISQNPEQRQKQWLRTQISQKQYSSTASSILSSSLSFSLLPSQLFKFQSIIQNQNSPSYIINPNLKKIPDPHKKYPYNCIVKIVSYKADNQLSQKPQQGTGFIIGNGVVLTVAHNVMNQNNNAYAKNIFVYPPQGQNGEKIRIKVKKVQVSMKYRHCLNQYYGPNVYDIALLDLDEKDMKKYENIMPKKCLEIKFTSEIVKKKIMIQAVGYPNQHNNDLDSCNLYQQTSFSYDQDGHYLYYTHKTTMGQSGMALFEQSQNQKSLSLVGIHKGIVKERELNNSSNNSNKPRQLSKTFGIIFNSFVKEIISQLAENMNIQMKLLKENYEKSKKMLQNENKGMDIEKDRIQKENKEIKLKMNKIQKENIELKRKIQEMNKEKINNIKKMENMMKMENIEKMEQKDKVKQANVKKNVIKERKEQSESEKSEESVQEDQNDFFKYDSHHVNILIDKQKYDQAYKLAHNAVLMCEKQQKQKQQLSSSYGDLARILLFCVSFHSEKDHIKPDQTKAFQLAQKGSSFNKPNSEYILGYCYFHKKGTEVNQQKGIEYYTKSAQKNNKYAQYQLALIYLQGGYQVKVNHKKAFELFKKSAQQNHDAAQYYLAECYLSGTGVTQDRIKGLQWLQQSKKLGYAPALKRLNQYRNNVQKK